MSMLFQLVLLALFSSIGLTHGAQKYYTVEGLKKCETKSSELNKCVKGNANVVWPLLVKGVKDFGIPPLEPFIINKNLDFSYNGMLLSGKFVAPKVKVVGLANLLLHSVDVKVSNNKITIKGKMSLPKLLITGNYSGQVKVTLLSMKPKGGFNLLLENMDIETETEADISSRDGHTFAKITKLNVEPKINKFHLQIDELILYSILSKTVINRINSNWRVYYNAVMPQTRKFWQPYIVELINKLLDVMPLENAIDL